MLAQGGGLHIDGLVTMTNSTILSNRGPEGSAVFVSAAGFLLLRNTFIINNTITNPGAKISYKLPTPPGTYLPNAFNLSLIHI